MRILSLYDKPRDSGQVSRLKGLLLAYAARGDEVHYIASEPLFEEEHPNIKAHLIWTPFRRKSGLLYWTWLSLMIPGYFYVKVLRIFPKRVIFFETYYSFLCWLPSVLVRAKKVLLMRAIIFRELEGKPISKFYSRLIDYTALLASDLIVAPTDSMRLKLLTRVPALNCRLSVLPYSAGQVLSGPKNTDFPEPNGSDPAWTEWLSARGDRKKSLCANYNIPEKDLLLAISGKRANQENIDHLLRAIADTESKRISLLVFGEYKEQQLILSVVHGLGLEDQVVFTGEKDDIPAILGACDVFLHCSGKEGMSTDLMCALSLGAGVQAIDTPEMREILQHNECLLPAEDVGALSATLLGLVKEKKALQAVKQKSQLRAQHFNFSWPEAIIDLIESASCEKVKAPVPGEIELHSEPVANT